MAVALVPGQTAVNAGTGSTLTLTLPGATTPGNCLAVMAMLTSSGGNGSYPSLSAVTLGGAADHFTSLFAGGGAAGVIYGQVDYSLTQASTSVVVTSTGGTGTLGIIAAAYEFSGIVAAYPLDQAAVNDNPSTSLSWTSTATPTTNSANEAWVGMGCCWKLTTAITATGPASPWTNLTAQALTMGTAHAAFVSGYQVTSSKAAATYAGTVSALSVADAAVVTLTPAPPMPPPRLFLGQAVRRASLY